ncbi:carbohydrate ABC transporter permease [Micromonospora cathayae]|uniref:Carbohydrate ABC transporter permease n=1 Tax=Micromonospora cathayae TaxID=3028804 RepID=A0ABY7ZLA3_9ACTN|nr:carbohydrate ABC transporter permease [Micromonospora sp. HUAS 3]WDZ83782.1 carbohydrate ABC transporter permease [Micromonospora sp. HUAS 3]
MRHRSRKRLGHRLVILVGVVFFVGLTLYPLAYMLSGSLKELGEIYGGFATLLPRDPTLDNYRQLLFNNTLDQTNFLVNARNSATVAAMTIAMTMAVSVPAAYVLARQHNAVVTVVRGWVRVAQVVGGIVVIIPLYLILRQLDLIDTLLAVSLAQTIPASAFSIWMLVAFIRQVPHETEEAARIDGAGEWRILRHVIVPLTRPGMVSVVLVVFLMSWNDFLNPLILLSDPSRYTVTVALYTFIGQVGQISWGQLLGFGLLSCVPALLVIIFAERHIVRGLLGGAVK